MRCSALAASEGDGGTGNCTTIGRGEANAAFEYCFDKATVLRLFN